jgi:hypothetical protein
MGGRLDGQRVEEHVCCRRHDCGSPNEPQGSPLTGMVVRVAIGVCCFVWRASLFELLPACRRE